MHAGGPHQTVAQPAVLPAAWRMIALLHGFSLLSATALPLSHDKPRKAHLAFAARGAGVQCPAAVAVRGFAPAPGASGGEPSWAQAPSLHGALETVAVMERQMFSLPP